MLRHGRVLSCDHPGCRARIRGARHPGGAVTSARRLALDRGWSRSATGGDLCPEHRAGPLAPPHGVADGPDPDPGAERAADRIVRALGGEG